MALRKAGARVAAVCPDGSPLAAVSGVHEMSRYKAFAPTRSLAAALLAMRPDLVVPCDERVVANLHELHGSASSNDFLRQLIERSIGAPAGYAMTLSRGASLALAVEEHIRVPETRVLRSEADVLAWCGERPLPGLMKVDGSWGGAGVILVESPASAVAAFRRMSKPIATWRAAKFLVSNHDPFPLAEWRRGDRSPVTGQDFVQGVPANIMVACWEGEVLASVGVKVIDESKRFGAATIIHPVEHDGMELAAKHIVRRLGLSGFCGLDFLIDESTDEACLIELNPRATQLGHFQFASGPSLAAALLSKLPGEKLPAAVSPAIVQDTIALFPQAWLSESASSWLPSAYRDIPWDEPALVAELRRRPWERRSVMARLTDIVLRRPDPARQLAESLGVTPADGAVVEAI